MANFYLDHNVSHDIAARLRERGHYAVVAQTLGLEAVADEKHLLLAADRRWTLVTHNKKDFYSYMVPGVCGPAHGTSRARTAVS